MRWLCRGHCLSIVRRRVVTRLPERRDQQQPLHFNGPRRRSHPKDSVSIGGNGPEIYKNWPKASIRCAVQHTETVSVIPIPRGDLNSSKPVPTHTELIT